MWSWRPIGFNDDPVGLLNINGFWTPLLETLERLVDAGFVRREVMDDLVVAETLSDALERFGQRMTVRSATSSAAPKQTRPEIPTRRGPPVERAGRAGLPHRDLVALADLGGGVAVQLQRRRQRGARVGPDRRVAGRGGRHLGDPGHTDRVGGGSFPTATLPTSVSRSPSCGTWCTSIPARRVARRPCPTRPAERRRRPEPDVVDQHHQHVRRPRRRPQRHDRWERQRPRSWRRRGSIPCTGDPGSAGSNGPTHQAATSIAPSGHPRTNGGWDGRSQTITSTLPSDSREPPHETAGHRRPAQAADAGDEGCPGRIPRRKRPARNRTTRSMRRPA